MHAVLCIIGIIASQSQIQLCRKIRAVVNSEDPKQLTSSEYDENNDP